MQGQRLQVSWSVVFLPFFTWGRKRSSWLNLHPTSLVLFLVDLKVLSIRSLWTVFIHSTSFLWVNKRYINDSLSVVSLGLKMSWVFLLFILWEYGWPPAGGWEENTADPCQSSLSSLCWVSSRILEWSFPQTLEQTQSRSSNIIPC